MSGDCDVCGTFAPVALVIPVLSGFNAHDIINPMAEVPRLTRNERVVCSLGCADILHKWMRLRTLGNVGDLLPPR